MAGSAAASLPGDHPTRDDADGGLRLVEALISADAAALVARALELVWATTGKLAQTPGSFGLIHSDLHCENFLFHNGVVRAIDFDDCGWGFHLYDLAVTLWELEELTGVRRSPRRPARGPRRQSWRCPKTTLIHLQALFVLRRMQMLMWALESRKARGLPRQGGRHGARDELDAIGVRLDALAA